MDGKFIVSTPELLYKTLIKDKKGVYKYMFKCSCGKNFMTYRRSVELKKCKSCGCLRNKFISEANKARDYAPRNRGTDIEISINYVFFMSRNASKIKNRIFELTKEDVGSLIFKDCYYCGQSPNRRPKRVKDCKSLVIAINGIDRFDNSLGYVVGNCVPCCSDCNYLKSSRNGLDFINSINKIFKNLTSTGVIAREIQNQKIL